MSFTKWSAPAICAFLHVLRISCLDAWDLFSFFSLPPCLARRTVAAEGSKLDIQSFNFLWAWNHRAGHLGFKMNLKSCQGSLGCRKPWKDSTCTDLSTSESHIPGTSNSSCKYFLYKFLRQMKHRWKLTKHIEPLKGSVDVCKLSTFTKHTRTCTIHIYVWRYINMRERSFCKGKPILHLGPDSGASLVLAPEQLVPPNQISNLVLDSGLGWVFGLLARRFSTCSWTPDHAGLWHVSDNHLLFWTTSGTVCILGTSFEAA